MQSINIQTGIREQTGFSLLNIVTSYDQEVAMFSDIVKLLAKQTN